MWLLCVRGCWLEKVKTSGITDCTSCTFKHQTGQRNRSRTTSDGNLVTKVDGDLRPTCGTIVSRQSIGCDMGERQRRLLVLKLSRQHTRRQEGYRQSCYPRNRGLQSVRTSMVMWSCATRTPHNCSRDSVRCRLPLGACATAVHPPYPPQTSWVWDQFLHSCITTMF